jgi:flagellar P-ring protein precursor FlgI
MARDIFANPVQYGRITLVLDQPYATWPVANLIAQTINDELGFADGTPAMLAQVTDPKNVIVQIPEAELNAPGAFISRVQEIAIDPTLVRTPARVMINKSTGTIVITGDVRLSPVGISHGGLTITTVRPPPKPTVDSPQVRQEDFVALDPNQGATREGARLADLLAAFNHLKVPAADRIAIIELISRSGKLHAKIEYVE